MTTPSSRRLCAGRSTAAPMKGCGRGCAARFGLVQGMCRVPGFEEVIDQRGPHRRGRAGAGGRSPASSSTSAAMTRFSSRADRRPRPGVPGLDGRVSRVITCRSRSRFTRASARSSRSWERAVRRAGQPQHADLHVEEHGRSPAAASLSLAAGPACALRFCADDSALPRALGGARAHASACWRRGVRSPWGRGDGSRGKRLLSAVSVVERWTAGPHGMGWFSRQAWRRLMSARAVHLVIDARPRGPHGPLAAEMVLGKSVLDHLLDLADRASCPPGKPVVVHAREDEHDAAARAGRRLERAERRVRQRAAASGCGRPADRSPLRSRPAQARPAARGDRRNRPCSGGSTGRNRCRPPRKS